MKKVYICSDSVTGIFSGIYEAWRRKDQEDSGIALAGHVEPALFCTYEEVEENREKAAAVDRMICRHLGGIAYQEISQAVLSDDPGRGEAVLGTMLEARRIPDSRRIMEHLTHPDVEKVFELSRRVGSEAHSLKGFVRFRELKGGILYAVIHPKNQVLPCLAPHFEERLPKENWMIYDEAHRMFAVHESGRRWVLVLEDAFCSEDLEVSEQEKIYEKLWKGFCETISISEREDKKAQAQHLPFRFRPYMTEFVQGG